MTEILVGTAGGLRVLGERPRAILEGHAVAALARADGTWWALIDGHEVWRDVLGTPERATAIPALRGNCLVATEGGTLLTGTAEARLFRIDDGAAEPVASFDRVEGRDAWYTPWGGPPDVRTMSAGPDRAIYANVHVGGIPVSRDGGESWTPTIEVDADVHQVLARPDHPGNVLAATAWGFAVSRDGGDIWEFVTDGLHAGYSRAVALAGDTVLLTASTGPRGRAQAAVYRRPVDQRGDTAFERCRGGLPEWFEGNIDSGWLDARGEEAAFAAPDGSVWVSTDAGRTWEQAAFDLPEPRWVALADSD
ncbi:MAG: glycoside hydrolase [Actinomycetota bacterium]|nr:glycoside hydrolase [Actinomycetota bacterium]